MTAKELTGAAMKMASEMIADGVEVRGMVLLHSKTNGLLVIPYKDDSMPVDIQQDIIISMVKAARKIGTFDGLVMVSEAWMATQTNPDLIGVLRPAQDPDRIEIVVAWAYGDDGSRQMETAKILRDGKQRLDTPEVAPDEVHSWLDDAFIEV